MLGIRKKKSPFSPLLPQTATTPVAKKKLHQWQSEPGFDKLDRRSRKALGTHGGYRRVGGRIPGQLEMGERSSSLVEGGNDMQQHRAGCRRVCCARKEKQPNALVVCVLRAM